MKSEYCVPMYVVTECDIIVLNQVFDAIVSVPKLNVRLMFLFYFMPLQLFFIFMVYRAYDV